MHVSRMILAGGIVAAALLSDLGNVWAIEPLVVDDMVVTVIDSVNVPANETGVITQLTPREGNSVKAGQSIGKLDDRKAQIQHSLADVQMQIAIQQAENNLAAELAAKKLAREEQHAKQYAIVHEIAARKAKNETRTLASKKTEAVAKNELDRATLARRQYVDSVSQSEIDGLRLAYQRRRLETQQAEFERQSDALQAEAENQAAAAHRIGIEQSKIEVAQAASDTQVNHLQAKLAGQQSRLAELAIQRHQIISPINGVVVQRMRSEGDWVAAGDTVVRVVRLNRLRGEGFVTTDKLAALRANRTVDLSIDIGGDVFVNREGRVVFISPEIDPVNNEVRFWVEFENPDLDVLPGMRLSLKSK